MPDGEVSSKELINDSKEIEDDPILTELDNVAEEEVGTLDNEVDSETESTEEETDKEEAEDDAMLDKVPDIQVNGDTLESSEGNVSVKIDQELENGTTDDTSGMQMTEEEKSASNEVSQNPAEIFGTTTGASRIMGEDMEESTQQDDLTKQESEPQGETNNVFDANTGAGEVIKISKTKKFLFSTILGFKRAKKGISNFFKKKLPKAFKSGAKVAKNVLKFTPMAPLVTLVDMVIEHREKTRPQREEKAKLKEEAKKKKKEQWLLDQDEKRHKKEEQERIKQKEKELKAQAKEAKALQDKLNNTLKYRTGKFFKGIWKGIKTGAKWIWKKIKDSKVGVKVGAFGAKTIKKVKAIVEEVKVRAVGVITSVSNTIDQVKNEYDAFSFEDRMQRVTEEENAKRQRGEDVPAQDYRTRYLALTDELKVKLSSIRKNISRREEIEEALAEMEGNGASVTTKSGEEVNVGEWTESVGGRGADSQMANAIIDAVGVVLPKIIPYTNNRIFDVAKSLAKMGSEIGKSQDFRQRKNLMDAIVATTKDQLIRRMSRYAKDNAEIQEITAGFDAAINALEAAESVGNLTGMVGVASAVSTVKDITTGIKNLVTASKTRAGVKNGIKDMLGGKDGYYTLKAKYKMHAPEMRRAVRDALGVASSEDAVTADKWELSHLMSERAKSGVMDRDTERMVAEAGGKSEKKFDALQGAGASVKRRFANRRVRMIS